MIIGREPPSLWREDTLGDIFKKNDVLEKQTETRQVRLERGRLARAGGGPGPGGRHSPFRNAGAFWLNDISKSLAILFLSLSLSLALSLENRKICVGLAPPPCFFFFQRRRRRVFFRAIMTVTMIDDDESLWGDFCAQATGEMLWRVALGAPPRRLLGDGTPSGRRTARRRRAILSHSRDFFSRQKSVLTAPSLRPIRRALAGANERCAAAR